jgi:hypothetical protein
MIHELIIGKDLNGRGHNLIELLYWNVVVEIEENYRNLSG